MKILEAQSAVLSNYEVLQIAQEQQSEYAGTDGTGRKRRMPKNLERVLKDLQTHLLRPSASPLAPGPENRYSPAAIGRLFTRLRTAGVALEKGEALMLVNLRPADLAQLECVVEEAGTRFTDDQLELILRLVREELGGVEPVEQEDGEGEEGDGGDERMADA